MKQMLHGETTLALRSSKNNNVPETSSGQKERKNHIYTLRKHDTMNLCLLLDGGGVERGHSFFFSCPAHFPCALHEHMYTIVRGM